MSSHSSNLDTTHQNDVVEQIRPKSPACMRDNTREAFLAPDSFRNIQHLNGKANARLEIVYIGISIAKSEQNPDGRLVGVTVHDGTYSIDYELHRYRCDNAVEIVESESSSGTTSGANTPATGASSPSPGNHVDTGLAAFIIAQIDSYRQKNNYKITGAGMTEQAAELCPELPSLLWLKLDIVGFIFAPFHGNVASDLTEGPESQVDEESDSVVRKAIEQFGPGNLPRLMVKYRNKVCVDVDGRAHLTRLEDYQNSVHANTWKATMHYAASLKKNHTKIAFFNTTPQGGGVALMRHALIRFLQLVGVDCAWYVPRSNHSVFRITKTNHNILQGVNEEAELTSEHIGELDEWCEQNASRYWTRKGGPLAARSKGGAHIIVIDDPQMPKLVDIAKQNDPDRPVIFRSHIQVRADRANDQTTNTARVWNWVWRHVQQCDVFVSHPVPDFIPENVTPEKVGYMPATTDWLDGLNKPLGDWDNQYYMHEFLMDIRSHGGQFNFQYPHRQYIVQIARFDPAKGIPDVLASYACLRREYIKDWTPDRIPQLVIAGHGAVDDPDAKPIYDQTMNLIEEEYEDLKEDIIVMRVGPTDQILNVLMRNAYVALQLSTREGFEVKVSEALHAGIPIIATRRGGIPLQVHPERSGHLIHRDTEDDMGRLVPRDPKDIARNVAKSLHFLLGDRDEYESYSQFAATHVSDEVSTVGNALCWLYLADTLAKGKAVVPKRNWIHDMARESAKDEGVSFDHTTEERLPRTTRLQPSQ